jgi:adenosylcobyric acid synthase
VILAGDIDRGGVIAQIVGTKAVLDPADATMIAGFLVNKFRGDSALFASGMRRIEDLTGWPGLGLIRFCAEAARLPEEDSLGLSIPRPPGGGPIIIAIPVLPGIANFDDLDPLYLEGEVRVVMVRRGETLPAEAALVILPGSKTTIAGLAAFRRASPPPRPCLRPLRRLSDARQGHPRSGRRRGPRGRGAGARPA